MTIINNYIDFMEKRLLQRAIELETVSPMDGKCDDCAKYVYDWWERCCDICIEWLEGQCPEDLRKIQDFLSRIKPESSNGDLQPRTARVARLMELRKALRKHFLRVDTSVPAIARNGSVTSVVQAINRREIGLLNHNSAHFYNDNLKSAEIFNRIYTRKVRHCRPDDLLMNYWDFFSYENCNKHCARSYKYCEKSYKCCKCVLLYIYILL